MKSFAKKRALRPSPKKHLYKTAGTVSSVGGEIWIDKSQAASEIDVPFRFTGKERDVETGLYYYGARYLDSKTSRWISTDPALGDYVPGAPINDEAKKRNGNLPGMGGVFNVVNFHLYHYAGNNPVKYVDPDGQDVESVDQDQNEMFLSLITKIAGQGFYFDENNKLNIDADIDAGDNYSATARSQLTAAIGAHVKTAYLKAAKEFMGEEGGGGELGRAMWVDGSQSKMAAIILGPQHFSSKAGPALKQAFNTNISDAPKVGLIHELFGHVMPGLGFSNGKNARTIEKTIRSELGMGSEIGSNNGFDGAIPEYVYSIKLDELRKMK
jgi:RHS repeat-associated protein